MDNESVEVKIARVEEGIKSLHSDVRDIKSYMEELPCSDHGREIEILKNDKKWIKGLTVFLGGVAGWLVSLLSGHR